LVVVVILVVAVLAVVVEAVGFFFPVFFVAAEELFGFLALALVVDMALTAAVFAADAASPAVAFIGVVVLE
jgi:hypothetical protein